MELLQYPPRISTEKLQSQAATVVASVSEDLQKVTRKLLRLGGIFSKDLPYWMISDDLHDLSNKL